jgi:hypothetical protein
MILVDTNHMTTINLTGATPDVPTNINTIERAFLHLSFALQATLGGKTFNLDNTQEGSEVLHISISQGFSKSAGEEIIMITAYIPVEPEIRTNSLNKKPWLYAKEITNNNYPPAFRVG